MGKFLRKTVILIAAIVLALGVVGCGAVQDLENAFELADEVSGRNAETKSDERPTIWVTETGEYTKPDEVALYIHSYGHLPSNYISKTKARLAGWVNTDGNLWDVAPGKSIGGSEFYDDDGQHPDAPGRKWTECDVNYKGGYRGAERLVFSNDGYIFYTGDHYKTFKLLYEPEEEEEEEAEGSGEAEDR